MMQSEAPEKKKKGVLDRLPRLGRISQLVLVIGVCLVVFVALWFISNQLTTKQNELKGTWPNLQRILSTAQTPKDKFEAELAQATAGSEAAKAVYPRPNQAPEILDSLLELAEVNDIYFTGTQVATSTPTGSIGPVLTITLNLKGQVSLFQNFLLGLDTKLPTSQIKQVTFTITGAEGEYDTATVVMDVLCYGGS
jgi:hypothetical protein